MVGRYLFHDAPLLLGEAHPARELLSAPTKGIGEPLESRNGVVNQAFAMLGSISHRH